MNLNYEDEESLKREFLKEMHWFESELDFQFGGKTSRFTKADQKIAERLLDQMSEIINKYSDESSLFVITTKLNEIEKKYPELFKDI